MKNRIYAELLHRYNSNTYKILGTDGQVWLDNRKTIGRMRQDIIKRIYNLRFVQPHIIGYIIRDRHGNELYKSVFEDRQSLESCGYYTQNIKDN